ncbi:NADH-quinone oxidoreductase subunit G [Rhodococcus sp. 05-340-1]|uniref:NADH-quinone oxidoreductase subunit G n=1 Tax=unclassified Rhodococcus (in: high G+C Gram-positive bacteria) TaxID=192944 RepID=UPI000B9C1154|nr:MULTISPECIES: NADH-quinone oxidoreductase subunit G [unclassified Rhodococcus (in: high G+C Gram-positive bacteria)]OZD66569.1 NADH-quinone oxidoreductase subunit G [Rhodococcus sp. 05-340-2]OZD80646.1 NADH-quinone oxidoreductase subunit G [Rhodococcus sp. 05-340-1]
MTAPADGRSAGSTPAPEQSVTPVDMVTLTIDDHEISVPKGTLVIRAAELMGVQIPRFCDHPLLDPVGACRQCLVDVEGQRKPLASCTTTVAGGMIVRTQVTSESAEKAQRGVMELLLINHPLDCPVCDKGGECPLQNQAMAAGRSESRFVETKRTYPKPIPLSAEILLDRERCVLCARCTRFAAQVAGDPSIDLLERGAVQQVGIFGNEPFDSYFSGNTVQICPVGALTNTEYRFRARPYDLTSSPSVCEHCAGGCAQRTDHRRGKVLRRLAGDDPQVNEEWNCDKGRWAFKYATEPDRITAPMIRDESGKLIETSWSAALAAAAAGLAGSVGHAAVLVGGRSTLEDSYAYAKFARTVLHTNDIDFRNRSHSAEEADFLAGRIAATGLGVTYTDLENAPVVVLVGFEPEEESPLVFLRLRKAHRTSAVVVASIAPFSTRGLRKLDGVLLQSIPGDEPGWLDALHVGDRGTESIAHLLREPGAIVLVGERLGSVPGGLAAASKLADDTGASLAWIPRRAGERGALDAGALPNVLPGGRPVADAAARAEVAAVWGVPELPEEVGRDTAAILADAGPNRALVTAGIDLDDLPDPQEALDAVDKSAFVVSLELRHSAVTERADVVFPVAPVVDKSGTFVDWEGRPRAFDTALGAGAVMPDQRILDAIAAQMGVALAVPDAAAARAELARLGVWNGPRTAVARVAHRTEVPTLGPGEAILTTWRMLIDAGRMQDGEDNLAATGRTPTVRLSATTASSIGAETGDLVSVVTDRGSITLPLTITDLPDTVVWIPMNSPGSAVYRSLGVQSGAVVRLRRGSAERPENSGVEPAERPENSGVEPAERPESGQS